MSFYSQVLVKLPLFDTASRVSTIDYLEPQTRAAVLAILQDAMLAGTPLMVFETYRSQARQELLFDQGATQLKELGVHGYGLAADLVKDVVGEPSWKGSFDFLGILAKKHGLVWGGDWGLPNIKHGFVDAVHVQRVRVQDQVQLFDASWYPSIDYSPYKTVDI